MRSCPFKILKEKNVGEKKSKRQRGIWKEDGQDGDDNKLPFKFTSNALHIKATHLRYNV